MGLGKESGMNGSQQRVFKISVTASVVVIAGVLAGWGFQQEFAHHDAKAPEPLRDYGVVWENKLTRSGMPRSESGWQWLRNRGTTSIVTFRTQNDVDYGKFGFERVLRIPLKGTQVPTDEQADQFLGFIQDPRKWTVHMHCSAGKDRTGMMAAMATYAIDEWPLDKALAEAKLYRDGHALPGEKVAWLESWATKHRPGSYRRQQTSAGGQFN
jgi:protein tyrosine/serine phosphatase